MFRKVETKEAIQLNVFKGNANTISIYNKLGFEIIDKPQIEIGNGFILDDYVMKKILCLSFTIY